MFSNSFNYIIKTILLTFIYLLLSFSSNIKGINLGLIELYPARIIVFGWLIYSLFSKKIRELNILVKPMIIFILWGIILTVINFSNQSMTSILVYITSFATMLMFASITNSKENLYCISTAIVMNLIIQALLGIRESFTGEYMYVSYENYVWHYNDFGLNLPKTTFFNTNNYAVYCILCLPLVAICKKSSLYMSQTISYSGYILGCVAIILTGSRTGLLCIALYFIVYFYLNIYKNNKNKFLKLLIFICIYLLFIFFFTNIIQFIDLLLPSGNVSDEDRLPIWSNYISICFNNLLVYGVPGGSKELLMNYIGSNIPPHFMFLEILVEYGVIGLICILSIINKLRPRKDKYVSVIYKNITIIFLCIFLISSICPSTMTGCYYLWAIFGVFYSIINNKLII